MSQLIVCSTLCLYQSGSAVPQKLLVSYQCLNDAFSKEVLTLKIHKLNLLLVYKCSISWDMEMRYADMCVCRVVVASVGDTGDDKD